MVSPLGGVILWIHRALTGLAAGGCPSSPFQGEMTFTQWCCSITVFEIHSNSQISRYIWVVTKRMRSQMKEAEKRFLWREARLSLEVSSFCIWGKLGVELLERSQLRWFRHLIRMPAGCLVWGASWRRLQGRLRTYWKENTSLLAWKGLEILHEELRRRISGCFSWICGHCDSTSDKGKRMDGLHILII